MKRMALLTIPSLLAASLAITAPPSPDPAGAAESASRPNILVIVTDDQRPGQDTMAVMPKTLQWLDSRGVEFPNGVVTTPLCCPSRASIFSGQYVHNNGVEQLRDPYRLNQQHTMQYTLKEAGYRTAIAGKYLNQWDLCNDDPPYFDRFAIQEYGYHDTAYRVDYYTGENHGANIRCEVVGGDGHGLRVDYSTTFIRDKAVEFLEWFEQQGDEDPWLLYVAPYAPHPPSPVDRGQSTVEERYRDAPVPAWNKNPAVDEADISDKPPHVRDTDRAAHATSDEMSAERERQLRTLMSVDDLVGTLRGTIGRLDESRNTLVIFLSDNGFLWGDHQLQAKREPYRMSAGVPFYARWSKCGSDGRPAPDCPGVLVAGTEDKRLAANIDVAATAFEAAGVTPAYVVDGKSLFDPTPREHILIEHWRNGRCDEDGCWGRGTRGVAYGVTTYGALWSPGNYLYRENYYDPDEGTQGCHDDDASTPCEYFAEQGEPDEYYDLSTDPYELVNLLNDGDPSNDPSDRSGLSRDLDAARSCKGSTCP